MRKVGKFRILTVCVIVLFSPVVAQDDGKPKVKTELINIAVMVKDADGKRIPDLKKEDFEIYEDGVLQEIADFKPAPHPLRLILLFDTSVSMGAIFPGVKDEAVKLVESLDQLDEIMIGSFDAGLQLSSDWGGKALATTEILALKSTSNFPPTPQNPQPMPRPGPRPRFPGPVPGPGPFPMPRGRMEPDKNTNLFGAMRALFDRVGGRSGNEVVLIFSDGKDSVQSRSCEAEAGQRPEAGHQGSSGESVANLRRMLQTRSGKFRALRDWERRLRLGLRVPLRNRRRRRRALFRVRIAIRFCSGPEEDAR